jgi:HEAT repeat protein
MPRNPAGLISLSMLLAAVAGPSPCLAQNDPTDTKPRPATKDPVDDADDLKEKLLWGEHDEAVPAAIELFDSGKPHYDGKQDSFLESVLRSPAAAGADPGHGHASAPPRARRALLEAMGYVGRNRASVACRLARIGLSDSESEVRDAAANTLAGIERPEAYAFLRDALKELKKSPPGTPQARDLDVLVSVIERKKDPIAATGVFVDALPVFDGPEEQRIHAALKRLTGRSFETDEDWIHWYQEHRNIPQREWYLEALKASEEASDRASSGAERIFEKLIQALAKDETALLRELEEQLAKDTLPSVRGCAIRNLGLLGARPGPAGDRAVALLEGVLKLPPKDQDEWTLRAALVGLGRTARAAEVPVVVPFIDSPVRTVRLAAAAALGSLKADASVAPLTKALAADPPLEQRDAEAAATYARALGAAGRDPENRASACLLGFVARVSAACPITDDPRREPEQGTAPPGPAPGARAALLQASAEALGGLGPALAPEGETAAVIVSSLAALSAPAEHQDVRWWATTSLGRIPHRIALSVLASRMTDETLNVRRAAVGAIGLQARRGSAPEDLERVGVALLAQELAGTEDSLKRAARTELEEVVAHDAATFGALEALVEALSKRGAQDLAAPFLEGLPLPDKLTDAQKKFSVRYWSLIETRAAARLRLQDGRGAAADYDLLLAGTQPMTPAPGLPLAPRQRGFMLGRARALLASGDARGAVERAADLARTDPKDDAAWSCLRACADALLARGERVVVKEVFASLDKAIAQASTESQGSVQETIRRADTAVPPTPPSPLPQAPPRGGP